MKWWDWTGGQDLRPRMLCFKTTIPLSSFTVIKRLFSSSLSAIRVVSFAYLRLLIFFLAILIPACVSSSPACWMMYSAYKLNKQGDSLQPFLIWNQSVVPRIIYTPIHMYFICSQPYLYQADHEFILMLLSLTLYHLADFSFLSLFICKFTLQKWKNLVLIPHHPFIPNCSVPECLHSPVRTMNLFPCGKRLYLLNRL